tara:strand:+ start:132 stop:329 length:198 start_codon:yes stop_codon:yes gene_type:complete
LTDSKTTKDRKEEKESHKLRQQNAALKKDIVDLIQKHNNLLMALSGLGLNIQVVCNQNKFNLSKA